MKLFLSLLLLGICISSIRSDSNESMIDQMIDDLVKQIPGIKKDLDTNPATQTEVIKHIIGKGFTTFEQSGSVQKIMGVAEKYLDPFLDNLQTQLHLPAKYSSQLKDVIHNILWEESDEWNTFNVVFNDKNGGDSKYVCLVGRHNWDKHTTDWVIADIQGTFTLAPDIYVVKSCHKHLFGHSCSEHEVVKPHAITQDQLVAVFSFFEIVAFERFKELKSDGVSFENSIIEQENGIMDTWSAAANVISEGTKCWEGIVKAFKSSKSVSIVKELTGKGFDYFQQSGQVQKIGGLDPSYLDVFLSHLIIRLKVPDDKKDDFKDVVMDCIFMGETEWKAYNIAFSKDSKGTSKMAQLMMNRNSTTGQTNWLIADMDGSFKLAPNLLYVRTQLSVAGGIWASDTIKIKEVPRSLTEDDVKAFYYFFWIMCQKNMGDSVGLKLNYPKI